MAPPRTVLHVLVFFPRGGSAQVVRYLGRFLSEAGTGWRARVVAGSVGEPGDPGHAPGFFAGVGDVVSVDYGPALRAPDPLLARPPLHPSFEERPGAPDRLFASLDDGVYAHHVAEWMRILGAPGVLDDVAVAHLHHLTPAHEAVARLRPALPVVVHLHGTELLMLRAVAEGAAVAHGAAWAARMRGWAARAAAVVAPSTAAARMGEELLGLPPGRVATVPNGIDPGTFDGRRAGPAERIANWRRWLCEEPQGWTPEDTLPGSVRYRRGQLAPLEHPDTVITLFVGRFTAVKRAALLVRAHAIARERLGRPLPLVLWGGARGEWEDEHPAHAAAASPWGHEVFLAGWRGHRELPEALASADLLAVPSVAEKFGQVYIEAMAMGVPPIACDAEGPPTFIDADPASSRRAGWLVPPDDERGLADALLEAAGDREERARRAVNGRASVRERFLWPAIAPRVAAIYDEVAGP